MLLLYFATVVCNNKKVNESYIDVAKLLYGFTIHIDIMRTL